MRLGIMGGTFDPIHYGHLFVAEEARAIFGLEKVLFVPNGNPPHKKDYAITSARHRFAMTQIATAENPFFQCSSIEQERDGPSYTYETLALLRKEYSGHELYYITGVDAVSDILSWKRHEEVIGNAKFIAATRPGFDPEALKQRLPEAYMNRIYLLRTTAIGTSSTDIRERVRTNLPVRYLTSDGVLDYIRRQNLYGAGKMLPGNECAEGDRE